MKQEKILLAPDLPWYARLTSLGAAAGAGLGAIDLSVYFTSFGMKLVDLGAAAIGVQASSAILGFAAGTWIAGEAHDFYSEKLAERFGLRMRSYRAPRWDIY